jgi:two-component system, cell cycle response regulator
VRVLLAEDEAGTRRLVEVLLRRWGYDVVVCADAADAWTALQEDPAIRLALLNWSPSGLDGAEVCRRMRAQPRDAYVYAILLTSRGGVDDVVAGLEAGADDYVAKPFHPSELRMRLHAGQRIVQLQDDLIAAREALRRQATHDGLTGLWNRGAILELLHRETARAARCGEPLAVLMVDVDHFKAINDAHGHAAGDAMLREVAEAIGMAVRPYDMAGRYGGEEFLCVLPGCGAPEAAAVAERIREAVERRAVWDADRRVQVTVSAGVAAGPRLREADEFLRAADAALYRAKAAGRNRAEVADAEQVSIGAGEE